MPITVASILVISTLVQLVAAVLALRLMRVTGARATWLLIAGAIGVMALRRLVMLADVFWAQPSAPPSLTAETVGLVISLLVLIGIATVDPWYARVRRTDAELHRVNEALRGSEAEYRGLVEHSPLGIYRSTVEGRFRSVNSALVDMLGYDSAEDLMAVGIADVYRNPDDRQRLIETLGGTETIRGLDGVRWKRRDGTELLVRLSGRIVRDAAGQIQYFEMIAEDVTELRMLESQLRQAQKMEQIGQLTTGIAHDFNNLLSVVLVNTQLIKDDMAAGRQPEPGDLEAVEHAVRQAAAMIKQLLGFSRRADLSPVPTDLAAVVRGLAPMLRRTLPEDIAIEMAADGPAPTVRADPRAVEEMVLNLAINARDAMPNGGTLRLTVAGAELGEDYVGTHPGARAGSHACVSVSDTGTGMDPDTLRQAFEPFFTTKAPGRGTGLGLAMVYGLTKQQAGFVHITSEPGRGTTARLHFPAITEAPWAVHPRRVQDEVRGGAETVLLVEDEEALRHSATRVLEAFGYTVIAAPDGPAALECYDARRGSIDLVISDLVMPQMTGLQLHEALRQRGGPFKFVLASGPAGREVAGRDATDPAIPLVSKPWELKELLGVIRQVLDR